MRGLSVVTVFPVMPYEQLHHKETLMEDLFWDICESPGHFQMSLLLRFFV